MRGLWGLLIAVHILLVFAVGVFADETKIDSLTTADGKTYTEVVVKRFDPSGIDIIYSGGAAHLLFSRLPKEIQSKYGYDVGKSEAFLAQKAIESQKAEAEVQAELTSQEEGKQLLKSAFRIHVQIEQFTSEGALCHCSVVNYVDVTNVHYVADDDPIAIAKHRIRVEVKETRTELLQFPEMVWITGLPSSLVDGDTWSDLAWSTGTYNYTTVLGGTAKVRAFTIDPVRALRWIQNQ